MINSKTGTLPGFTFCFEMEGTMRRHERKRFQNIL